MTAATHRGRWTWMSIGSLFLCAFCFPTQALGNIWTSTFGQGWFYESRAWKDQVLAGTWWEESLKPGRTYNITFRVTDLNGRAKLWVGGRSAIDINRKGWHSYDFKVWNGGPRKMAFTTARRNTTLGVKEIWVTRKSGSGSASRSAAGGGGADNWLPRGHYLAFSRERNLKAEMLNMTDRPARAPSNWHLNMAWQIRSALTTPGVKGFSVRIPWRALEVRDGRYDWTAMDANMAVARRFGLKYIVQVGTRSFDGQQVVPRYFPQRYSIWHRGSRRDAGFVAKLWDPWVSGRLIRLYKAIARRYSGDPAFGGIATDETALGQLSGGNYSYWKYRNALIRIAKETQWSLRHGRLFMYMNFLKGGVNFDMRKDGRVGIVKSIPHHALAIGAPDITPDLPGMPGNLNSFRIHLRKNLPGVHQFCHAMHIDQGAYGVNRKSNAARRRFADYVRRTRNREQQAWFRGQRAVFQFDDLRAPNGRKVDRHPQWVLGRLWGPGETFAFAKRNFGCDYFFWNFRGSNFKDGGYHWKDVRPVVVNNKNL